MSDKPITAQKIRTDLKHTPEVSGTASDAAPARLWSYTQSLRHWAFAIFCVASIIAFWGPLNALVRLAYNSDYYSHTVVIPFLAGYLIFLERRQIFSGNRASLRLGVPLLLAGICLFILQNFTLLPVGQEGQFSFAILSLVLFWVGGFAICYGERAFREALFPLLLLFLTVPLPLAAMDDFIHVTRLGSTEVASAIFGMSGLPVLRQGFLFVLPGLSIEVAKECSGIHSTIALFVLTLVVGYLFLRSPWKRAFLLLFVFPIVSLTNGLRIATLTILAEYVDRNILNSSLHRDGGILFFLLAFGLMMLVVRFTSRGRAIQSVKPLHIPPGEPGPESGLGSSVAPGRSNGGVRFG